MSLAEKLKEFKRNCKVHRINGVEGFFTRNPLIGGELTAEFEDNTKLYRLDRAKLPESPEALADYLKAGKEHTGFPINEDVLEAVSLIDREDFFSSKKGVSLYYPLFHPRLITQGNKTYKGNSALEDVVIASMATTYLPEASIGIFSPFSGYLASLIAYANPHGENHAVGLFTSFEEKAAENLLVRYDLNTKYTMLEDKKSKEMTKSFMNHFDVVLFNHALSRKSFLMYGENFLHKRKTISFEDEMLDMKDVEKGLIISPISDIKKCDAFAKNSAPCLRYIETGRCIDDINRNIKVYNYMFSYDRGKKREILFEDVNVITTD